MVLGPFCDLVFLQIVGHVRGVSFGLVWRGVHGVPTLFFLQAYFGV